VIRPDDLTGVDATLARRIIAVGRSIAPGIDNLAGDLREDALAILAGVAGEAKARGSRLVKSQRIGPASVDYTATASWFSEDDKNALRNLCVVTPSTQGPIGQFPAAGMVSRVWPELREC